jgi:tight adherence protein C
MLVIITLPFLGMVALLVWSWSREQVVAARMRAVAEAVGASGAASVLSARDRGAASQASAVTMIVGRLRLLSSKEAMATRRLMVRAGIASDTFLSTYLFIRVGLPLFLAMLVLLNATAHVVQSGARWTPLFGMAAVLIGFYGPPMFLKNKINRRRTVLTKSLPDGLDLLVICLEAGLSLNETFGRVGRELVGAHPDLAAEFRTTAAELAFLPQRRQALTNLVERTDLEALGAVVTTLLQAERFGTPIAQALRVLSADFRARRMMAAEERAARLPVLLTMPMMVFILPVLFIVLLGPAALKAIDTFSRM